MIDDSPTVDHAGTETVWPAWNPSGTTLYLAGTRPTVNGEHSSWFCNADFSRMRPAQGAQPAFWAPEDPNLYYAPTSPGANVTRNNWRTGEQKIVGE